MKFKKTEIILREKWLPRKNSHKDIKEMPCEPCNAISWISLLLQNSIILKLRHPMIASCRFVHTISIRVISEMPILSSNRQFVTVWFWSTLSTSGFIITCLSMQLMSKSYTLFRNLTLSSLYSESYGFQYSWMILTNLVGPNSTVSSSHSSNVNSPYC